MGVTRGDCVEARGVGDTGDWVVAPKGDLVGAKGVDVTTPAGDC